MIDEKKTLTTPPGIAVYPRLTTPDTKFKKEGVYSVRLRIEDPEQEAALIAQLQGFADDVYAANCKAEKKTKLKRADNPWKPETEKVKDEDGNETENETGFTLFNFKMTASGVNREKKPYTRKPSLFDAKGASLMGQFETINISGGSKIIVAYTCAGFFTAPLGSGITLRLQAVQILDLVSYEGKTAEGYGFGKADGFDGSQAAAPAADGEQPEGPSDTDEF